MSTIRVLIRKDTYEYMLSTGQGYEIPTGISLMIDKCAAAVKIFPTDTTSSSFSGSCVNTRVVFEHLWSSIYSWYLEDEESENLKNFRFKLKAHGFDVPLSELRTVLEQFVIFMKKLDFLHYPNESLGLVLDSFALMSHFYSRMDFSLYKPIHKNSNKLGIFNFRNIQNSPNYRILESAWRETSYTSQQLLFIFLYLMEPVYRVNNEQTDLSINPLDVELDIYQHLPEHVYRALFGFKSVGIVDKGSMTDLLVDIPTKVETVSEGISDSTKSGKRSYSTGTFKSLSKYDDPRLFIHTQRVYDTLDFHSSFIYTENPLLLLHVKDFIP
jgi:hypothetical protein